MLDRYTQLPNLVQSYIKMKFFVAFALCVVAVSTSPLGLSSNIPESGSVVEGSTAAENVPVAEITTTTTPIPILRQQLLIENGSFINSFETGHGIVVDESGSQKQIGLGSGTVSSGSFSFTNPEGALITLTWIANENGFQATGDHLPTPPPMPEHVVKMLADMEAALDAISVAPQTLSEAAAAVENSSDVRTPVESVPAETISAGAAPAEGAPAVESSSDANNSPVETVTAEAAI